MAADVRFVLEVQDIDPSNPATMVAPATVLDDDVIQNAPGFCTYALVNAMSMQCSIAYTYATHISLAEVRTALQNASYVTQLVGSLSDGAAVRDCKFDIAGFLSAVCAGAEDADCGELPGSGRAVAEVVNSASMTGLQSGADNGVRGHGADDEDSERAHAGGLRECGAGDSGRRGRAGMVGRYETWSDFLPGGAADIFPGMRWR